MQCAGGLHPLMECSYPLRVDFHQAVGYRNGNSKKRTMTPAFSRSTRVMADGCFERKTLKVWASGSGIHGRLELVERPVAHALGID